MTLDLTVVDAFTDQPFAGNPAAVAVVGAFPELARMRVVAREINQSATAFVVTRPDGDHDLRWFSPSVELDLCGHATLASAHVLGGSARFHTRSGLLTCTRNGTGLIHMDFPADPPVAGAIPPVLSIGGVRWFGRGRFDVLIEVEDAEAVRGYRPDFTMIAALGSRAVIVTGAGDQPGIDCVSRVFGPNAGIPEDPVTGSAHCTLAAHWGECLGKDDLVGRQVSPRGGTVFMHRDGDRVQIGGSCVTMAEVRMGA